jgi:hypothetical protein
MAKVFGVAALELRPGVSAEDFERFWINEYAPLAAMLGWTGHVARGDRGERPGKYAVIWEIPSVESRDLHWPVSGQFSRGMLELLEPGLSGAGEKLMTFVDGWPFTDYVEIGK